MISFALSKFLSGRVVVGEVLVPYGRVREFFTVVFGLAGVSVGIGEDANLGH